MNTSSRLLTVVLLTAIGCAHKVNHTSVATLPPPANSAPKLHTKILGLQPVPFKTKQIRYYDNVDLEFLPAEAKSRLRVEVLDPAALSLSRMTMIADGTPQELPAAQLKSAYCVVYNREAQPNLKQGERLKLEQPSVYRDVGTLQIYLTKGVYLQCLNFAELMTVGKLNQILGGLASVYLESARN